MVKQYVNQRVVQLQWCFQLQLSQFFLPYFPKTKVGPSVWVFFPTVILSGSLYLCPKEKRFWNDFLILTSAVDPVFAILDVCEGYRDLVIVETLDCNNDWRGPTTTEAPVFKQVTPAYTTRWEPSAEAQFGLSISLLINRVWNTQAYLEYFIFA